MGTNYIAPIWRMPENTNKDKLSNYSINMANANERITLTDGVDLGLNSTVSFWVNFSTNNNSVILADDINPSSSGYFLLLNTLTGDTYVRIGPNFGGTAFNTSWNLNQWYNIIIVRQGDTVELFKNNISLGTRSGYGVGNTTKFDCIGAKNAGTNPMYGQISQVVGFDYALSTDQRNYIYNLNNPMVPGTVNLTAPVAYYPLGDNSNPNAPGSFPNISTGADSVFDFNGSNESIRIIDTARAPINLRSIGNENSYTISGWINTTSTSSGGGSWYSYDTFIELRQQKGSGAHVPFSIGMTAGQVSFGRSPNYTGSAQIFYSTGTINDGNWHHIAFTVNVNSLKIYIDGSLDSSHTFTIAIGDCSVSTISSNLQIGARSRDNGALTNFAAGDYSNFQIWDTELIDTEVDELYNNGQPLMTGAQPQESNLQAWYKLNQSANWEADTANNWQIPDNRSAYPQSFTFNTGATSDSVNSPGYYNFTGDFTVSVWAKIHSIATYGMIFAIGSPGFSPPSGPGAYFAFAASNARIIYDDASSSYGPYFTSNNSWGYNKWYHIVVVKEGTAPNNLQIYINGQADSITGGSDTGVQGQLTLGRWLQNNSYRLDGNISNFQFWDTALSAPQVLTLYNNGTPLTSAIETENLQGWWKLDNTATWDGSEWDFPDLSGNAQTLRSNAMTEQNLANDNVSALNAQSSAMDTTNLVQSNLTRTQPYSNYSFNFDGATNDYINSTDDDIFSFGDGFSDSPFSMSAWIKTTVGTGRGIISKWGNTGTTGYEWIFWIVGPSPNGKIRLNLLDGTNTVYQVATGNTNVNTGEWVHIAATYDGRGGDGSTGTNTANQGIKIYVNGIEDSPYTYLNLGGYVAMHNTPRIVQLGGYNNAGQFDGQISNAAIFDRVLNEDEILNIYNNGVTQDLQALSTFSNNIVAWWPMDQRSSYYDGTNWVVRELENAQDGTGVNTNNIEDMVGNAPGSEANGAGSNLTIADLKGDMSNSNKNAYSINMGDYADGVTNPADSGRSTEIPTVP